MRSGSSKSTSSAHSPGLRRRRARSRRASVQPPRDAVGDEDLARGRRSRALRGRGSEPARAGARRTRCGSYPSPRPGQGRRSTRYEIFHDVLAPAVLAWRTRHEAERALERERAAARLRHRRVAGVAAVALVALAGTTALAVWALSQRADARKQALAADAGALAAKARQLEANAIVELGRDPEFGLLLAMHAARLAPAAGTEDVLRRALRESRVRTVADLGSPVSDLTALPGGVLAAVTERGGVRLVKGGTLGRVVLEPRRGAQTWLSEGQALTVRGNTLTVRDLPRGNVVATIPVPRGHPFRCFGAAVEPVHHRAQARGERDRRRGPGACDAAAPGSRASRRVQPERTSDCDGRRGRRRDRLARVRRATAYAPATGARAPTSSTPASAVSRAFS